jgi:hypothetical protein
MSAYDWQLSSGAPLCVVSDDFYRTVRETIFQQLTMDTTAEQWQAVLENLTRLRDELQQDIRPMHYGSLVGGHRCLDRVFGEARARLRNLENLQAKPAPPPPPEPAPEPHDLSLEDVVDIAEATGETSLGDMQEEETTD